MTTEDSWDKKVSQKKRGKNHKYEASTWSNIR